LTDEQGTKLSKSAGATSLRSLRLSAQPTVVFQQVVEWLDLPASSVRTANDLLASLRAILSKK
ncbi:MAG: hypothetical protein ABIQ93_07750, partial [Saprospiraceae bacterium]